MLNVKRARAVKSAGSKRKKIRHPGARPGSRRRLDIAGSSGLDSGLRRNDDSGDSRIELLVTSHRKENDDGSFG